MILETTSEIIITLSSVIMLIGAIGFFRFPDFYTRTHAATLLTVGGTLLALFGLALNTLSDPATPLSYSIKIMLIIIFMLITNPTAAHALADSAYREGVNPKRLEKNDLEKDHYD